MEVSTPFHKKIIKSFLMFLSSIVHSQQILVSENLCTHLVHVLAHAFGDREGRGCPNTVIISASSEQISRWPHK
jgi:hypothetical protein